MTFDQGNVAAHESCSFPCPGLRHAADGRSLEHADAAIIRGVEQYPAHLG